MSHDARLSLPHEHGGYLVLLGGAVGATARSPRPLAALACGVVVVAAFLARGPLEKRWSGGAPARWDGGALLALVAVGLGAAAWAVATVGTWRVAPALGAAPALIALSWAARRARLHRTRGFELVAMAGCGASVGLMALAGGAPVAVARTLALVLGAHAAAAVPLVRSELRPRERAQAWRDTGLALLLLAASSAVLLALGSGAAALAFSPRLLHLTIRMLLPRQHLRPVLVGLRETAALAATVALLVWLR